MARIIKNPYVVLVAILFLIANSSSHPTSNGGYTGAPGDGVCYQCHSQNNPAFDGNVTIDGVPSTITPGDQYQITVTVSNPNGVASEAGFQITALTASNTKAGNFTNASSNSSIKTSGGKQYFGHQPSIAFNASNEAVWTTTWTAPTTGNGTISFYGTGNIANGTGSTSGDKIVNTVVTGNLNNPSPLSVVLTNITNITCFGASNGSATASPSGGQAPYSYAWNDGETTATAFNLPPGNASVTVTDAANATATASTNISQPSQLNVNVISQTNPTCFNSSNGSISISATGGVGGYSYDWSNGATTATITNLNGGNYTVSVTDNNNCLQTETINLDTPPSIDINNEVVTNPTCFGLSNGSISITASGGSGGLNANWSNGQNGFQIINLAAGNYTVTVADVNNCQLISTYTLTQPSAINVNATVSSPITCFGLSNGVAIASTSGGNLPYSYLWSNGSTTSTASNLAAGTYLVTVTDNNACQKTDDLVLSQPSVLNAQTVSSTSASCLGIANGSASIAANGGTAPYSYSWQNGSTTNSINNVTAGTYFCTITDVQLCSYIHSVTIGSNQTASLTLTNTTMPSCFGSSNGSITIAAANASGYVINWSNGASGLTLDNVMAGTYTAIASNTQGCMSSPLIVVLSGPGQIVPTSEMVNNPSCFGSANGAITTTFGGGTGALNYIWSTGATTSGISNLSNGTYGLTVSDANTCSTSKSYTLVQPPAITATSTTVVNASCFNSSNGSITLSLTGGSGTLNTTWSNGQSGASISGLAAGSYAYTVTDANMCTLSASVLVTSPADIFANAVVVNETVPGQADGSITTNASGGVGVFSYLWSNGATTAAIDSLAPGLYNLTITDTTACSKTFQYNIQSGNCALAVSFIVNHVSCNGGSNGSVVIDASNGQAPYTVTGSLTNLPAGSYNYLVTDAAGCTFSITDVIVTAPTALNITVDTIINSNGPNNANGGINVTVSGGVGPYAYQWLDSTNTIVSTMEDASQLLPGSYTLNITDLNGCILQSDEIIVSFTSKLAESNLDKINIYPNPFTQHVRFDGLTSEHKLSVMDGRGQLMSLPIIGQDNVIDFGSLAPGLYIFMIEYKSYRSFKKLIKN